MTALEIIPPIALAVTAAVYVFRPQAAPELVATKTQLDYLRERKEVIYDNLRDLNFEYRAGKYPIEDYDTQRASLEGEAAAVLGEIDRLEAAQR